MIEFQSCPRCGHDEALVMEMNFPNKFACQSCGLEFYKFPNALVDE